MIQAIGEVEKNDMLQKNAVTYFLMRMVDGYTPLYVATTCLKQFLCPPRAEKD